MGKPVYELLGGQVHEKLRSYTYIYPEADDAADVYVDAELAAERASRYVEMGFTAVKFDPVSPFSAFDPRQLSLEELDRAEMFRAAAARGGRDQGRSAVRDPWPNDDFKRHPTGAAAGAL